MAGYCYPYTMAQNTQDPLISPESLQKSLTDSARFDMGLAEWALTMVSDTARLMAGRHEWTAESVPPAIQAVVSMAARRLYTNPDRMNRESSGDYSYSLDATVTRADIFTPTEISTLRSYSPSRRTGGLRTVSTRREEVPPTASEYVPDGTARGFPWYAGGDRL